jgi:DNA polymerase elongation subunit (family B)
MIEWGKYYYDTYLKNHYRPISIQSIIRHKLKKDMFNEFSATQIMNIRIAYPDRPLYTKIMEYLYRGGYVHANVRYVMELLKNVPSRDITSAYPYYMLVGYVPFKFKKENPLKYNEIKNNKSKCWFAKFKFKNVKSSTWHSIESISKCIEISKHINDNGRVMSAGEMVVYLNELDFEIYEKFYTWDSIECLELYSADKIKLPKYVIKNLFDAYVKKSILKKEGKPYADEKVTVNSYYGVMVTKFNEYDLQYNADTDTFTEIVADFEKVRKRAILLPQWGVWITSGIRNYLLNTAYKIIKAGGDCVYFDTDSIKYTDINYDYIFVENNKQVNKKVKHYCDYYDLDFNIISGLGEFDFEGLYPTFKTLGCKRYIYIDEKGNFKQTIAGLPKDTLVTFARDTRTARNKVDLFKYFDNQMSFDQTIKLSSIYNDTGFSMEIEGHKIEELSCLTLDNTPFTLKLKDVYLDLMYNLYCDRQEKRILG